MVATIDRTQAERCYDLELRFADMLRAAVYDRERLVKVNPDRPKEPADDQVPRPVRRAGCAL